MAAKVAEKLKTPLGLAAGFTAALLLSVQMDHFLRPANEGRSGEANISLKDAATALGFLALAESSGHYEAKFDEEPIVLPDGRPGNRISVLSPDGVSLIVDMGLYADGSPNARLTQAAHIVKHRSDSLQLDDSAGDIEEENGSWTADYINMDHKFQTKSVIYDTPGVYSNNAPYITRKILGLFNLIKRDRST